MQWVDEMVQYCSERLGGHHFMTYHSDYRYRCPTCRLEGKFMSALLQHIESDACREDLWNGDLTEVATCCDRGRYGDSDGYRSDSTDSWY
jgi:hypothetical protein